MKMKNNFAKGFLLAGIIASVFLFEILVPQAPAQADTSVCSTIEALLAAGVISADRADAARLAAGCVTQATSTKDFVSIIGSPTLELTYNALNRESQLVAEFNVRITAGINHDLNISRDSNGIIPFINGAEGNTDFYGLQTVTPINSPGGFITDCVRVHEKITYCTIPAGNSAVFQVRSVVSPASMFAGTYFAKLKSISAFYNDTPVNLYLPVPVNQTNSKTIIGEVSPYITSVNFRSNLDGRKFLEIYGVRIDFLSCPIVICNGINYPVSFPTGGSDFTLNISRIPELQKCTVQLFNKNTGNSNIVWFEVKDTASSTCFKFTRNLTIGSTGADVTALQNLLGIIPATGYFGPILREAVIEYQVANGISPADGFVGQSTIVFLNSTCGPVSPSISVISPNGGEMFDISKPFKVTLKTNNPYPAKHYINLVDTNIDNAYSLDSLLGSSGLTFTQAQIEKPNQSVTFNIPSVYNINTDNKFKVEVCVNNVCDKSDSHFRLVHTPIAPTSTPMNGSCAKTHYNCNAGSVGSTAEYSTGWQWWCNGVNGGNNKLCTENKAPVQPNPNTITESEIFCRRGDWYGKNSSLGIWAKSDLKYNPDQRFICHSDTNIYRCAKDTDETANGAYWNTMSTKVDNGTPAGASYNYSCDTTKGKWVPRVTASDNSYSLFGAVMVGWESVMKLIDALK